MKFELKNRWSGEVQVTAEIECAEDAEFSLKVGLAVKWAVEHKANLRSANLSSANLRSANLSYANLSSADLSYANLDDSTPIDTGETWKEYKEQTVPALLIAGGKALRDVIEQSWDCHSWENCPMAVAFDVHKVEDVPILYRPRAEQFIRYFDAKMLKKEEILKGV